MTIQSKLLKLAKNLNKFSFDDLLIMSEVSEDEVRGFIEDALSSNSIKQIQNEQYIFIKNIVQVKPIKNIENKKEQAEVKIFKPTCIADLIDPQKQKSEYEIFTKAPEYAQRKAIKYLLAFKASKNCRGKELRRFLEIWNSRSPEYKMSYASYSRNKTNYFHYGISSILPDYGNNKYNSVIPDDIYYKFRDLYLSPKRFSANQCLDMIRQETADSATDMGLQLPSIQSFLRRVKKEFDRKELEYYRTMPLEIPDFISTIKREKSAPSKKQKKNQFNFKTFTQACEQFIKSDYCKKLKPSSFLSYSGYVKNQLIPYFNDAKLENITTSKVNKLKQKMFDEGLTTSTVIKYINVLMLIMNSYYPEHKISDSVKDINERNYYKDMRILELEDIKKLLETAKKYYPDFYPLLLTAISTGMTRGELLALTWQDILWEEKQIRANKSLYKGIIVKHRTKNSIRNVDISDDLIIMLKTWGNECVNKKVGFIFPNLEGEAQDPDNMIKRRFIPTVKKSAVPPIRFIDLRDIYASLLIKQNLPLTYIQEQLGHSSPQVTAERYKFLLEKNQVKSLNVLDGVL